MLETMRKSLRSRVQARSGDLSYSTEAVVGSAYEYTVIFLDTILSAYDIIRVDEPLNRYR